MPVEVLFLRELGTPCMLLTHFSSLKDCSTAQHQIHDCNLFKNLD